MPTNEETKLNNNTPSANAPHSDLPTAPPLYIKLDWGHFESIELDNTPKQYYILDGYDRYHSLKGNALWDVRFTVHYIGNIDAKIIKYIHTTVQTYDRVCLTTLNSPC